MSHNCQTILQPCLTPVQWGVPLPKKPAKLGKRTDFCKPGSEAHAVYSAIPAAGGTSGDIAAIARIHREKVSHAMSDLFARGHVRREMMRPPEVLRPCYKYWRLQ